MLGYPVARMCISQRYSTWFTRLLFLVRGWGLGMGLWLGNGTMTWEWDYDLGMGIDSLEWVKVHTAVKWEEQYLRNPGLSATRLPLYTVHVCLSQEVKDQWSKGHILYTREHDDIIIILSAIKMMSSCTLAVHVCVKTFCRDNWGQRGKGSRGERSKVENLDSEMNRFKILDTHKDRQTLSGCLLFKGSRVGASILYDC